MPIPPPPVPTTCKGAFGDVVPIPILPPFLTANIFVKEPFITLKSPVVNILTSSVPLGIPIISVSKFPLLLLAL